MVQTTLPLLNWSKYICVCVYIYKSYFTRWIIRASNICAMGYCQTTVWQASIAKNYETVRHAPSLLGLVSLPWQAARSKCSLVLRLPGRPSLGALELCSAQLRRRWAGATGVDGFKPSAWGWQVARKSVMMVSGKPYALNWVQSGSAGL